MVANINDRYLTYRSVDNDSGKPRTVLNVASMYIILQDMNTAVTQFV